MPAPTPAQTHPLFNQSVQLLQAGRFGDADAICRQLKNKFGNDKELLHLQSVIAYQAGRIADAIALIEPVAAAHPEDASILNDLGMFVFAAGDLASAQAYFACTLKLAPRFAGAHFNMGNLQKELRDFQRAEMHLQTAYKLDPKFILSLVELINVQIRAGRAQPALQNARQLVSSFPKLALAHMCLGKALAFHGQADEAQSAFEKAVSLAPKDADILSSYCLFLAETGQLDAARSGWRKVLALKPDSVLAIGQLTHISKFKQDDPFVAQIGNVAHSEFASPRDRAAAYYALGKIAEDNGDYPQAFSSYTQGAQLRRTTVTYDKEANQQHFHAMKRSFSSQAAAELSNTCGLVDDTPIFIVGLPRSGTSLTEQILASHPRVGGAGELSEIGHQIANLQNAIGAGDMVNLIDRITTEQIHAAARVYLEALKFHAPDADRVVDKLPANFENLGFIRLMFPKAKIVHCRRNLLDTALSIFKTNFTLTAQAFSYDFEELADYCRLYLDLMAYWETLWPGEFYHLDYEALIADQEGQSRKLIAACGLEWDPACLEFFNTRKTVRTASISQVRQPIYNRSAGISNRYGAVLNPLRRALGLPDFEDIVL